MNKNFKFKNLILFLFAIILTLFIIGCKTPEEQFDVAYINSHLDAIEFNKYEWTKTINSGDFLLLEEVKIAEKQETEFVIKTTIKKLTNISNAENYETVEAEEVLELAENPISFEINEEDFAVVEVKKNSLTGSVKDVANVLGYSVKNLQIKIELNDNLKVSQVELSYVDPTTEFIVKLVVKYDY